MSNEKVRPIEFRQRLSKILAFPKSSEDGVWYSFTPKRIYKKPGQKWASGTSFNRSDLADLALASLLALYWYLDEINNAHESAEGCPCVECQAGTEYLETAMSAIREYISVRQTLVEQQKSSNGDAPEFDAYEEAA